MKDEIYFGAFTNVYGDRGYNWSKGNSVYFYNTLQIAKKE